MNASEFVPTRRMADIVGVSRQTLLRWTAAGVVPVMKGSRRTYRYHVPTVVQALQAKGRDQ